MTRVPGALAATVGCVVAGALLGEALGPSPAHGSVVVVVLAGLGALVVHRRARVALVGVACMAGGAASMQRALDGLVHTPLGPAVAARADVVAYGSLVGDPDGTRFTTRVVMRVDHLVVTGDRVASDRVAGRRVDGGGRRVLVVAGSSAGPRLRLLAAGDRVVVRGWLDPLDGFDTRLRWQHVVARLHGSELVAIDDPRGPIARVANWTRARVLAGSAALAPADRALLAGFLLGDTRQLPDTTVEQFRAAGLTHLLAVSGGNVAFVLALFAPVFARCSLRGRLVLGLAVLVLFGAMTRWEPSVLRAVTMAAIAMVARHLGRPTAGPRAVLLACVVLVLADPFLVHSVGFLLSASASFAITVLSVPIRARLPGPEWARETLSVTSAAQVGVAPVLLVVFGEIPLVSIPANLVAVPLVGPLTAWGFVAGGLGGVVAPVAPPVAGLLQVPNVAMLHALAATADLAARVPLVVDARGACGLVALSCLLAAVGRARRLRGDASPVPAR